MAMAAKSAMVESTRMSKAVKGLPSKRFRSSMTPKTLSPERSGTATIDLVSKPVSLSIQSDQRESERASSTMAGTPFLATQPATPLPMGTR